MNTLLKTLLLPAALLAMVTLQCCEWAPFADEKEVLSITPKFDIDLFEQNLQSGLGTQWTGYTYVINQSGTHVHSGGYGKWTQGPDGNMDADENTDLYAASVSKMITAVAILKAMEEKGGSVNNMLNIPIENFLPPIWVVDPIVSQLTFRQLLQHRSGFGTNVAPDYNALKNAVQVTPNNLNYAYSNANFGLMRILLFRLTQNKSLLGSDEDINANSTNAFEEYVQEKLFKPLNIEASVRSSKARYYRWGDPEGTPGWDIGTRADRLGSGGWYLSANDLAKFLAYLNNTEEILSKTTRDLMYNQFLGWSDGAAPVNTPSGDHGIYYAKGGSFCNAGADNACTGQGVRTLVVTFPNKVELVIMANNRGNNMSLTNMAFTAFDNAWK